MNGFEIEKLQSIEVDESSIALLVSSAGHLTPEARHHVAQTIKNTLPDLKIPILVIDRGLRIEVLKASAAKTIQEAIGDNNT